MYITSDMHVWKCISHMTCMLSKFIMLGISPACTELHISDIMHVTKYISQVKYAKKSI